MSKTAFEKIKGGLDEALVIAPYVAEIEALRAENEKLAALSAKASQEASQLRAALKPFAEMHNKWWAGGVMFLPIPDEHTVLVEFIHLREAKEALNDPR